MSREIVGPSEPISRQKRKTSLLFPCWQGNPQRSEHAEAEDAIDRVETGQHAFADQVAQGFGRAAAQGAVAGAAVEARDREFVGEALAAMPLDGFAGDSQ